MVKERIDYEYKGLMQETFGLVILILTILKFCYKMDNEFVFITRILSLSISVLIFIISVIKVNNRELGILRLIGIGCFFIAVMRFIGIEISYSTTDTQVLTIFTQVLIYLEILNIILSMIIYYKKYSEKIQWIIFLLLTPIIYLLVKYESYNLKNLNYFSKSKSGPMINLLIGLILFIIILVLYKKFKLGKKDRWIIEVSSFLVLSNISFLLNTYSNKDFSYFIWISKVISYFLLYDKFEKTLLDNAYSSADESLNKAKEIKKSLNKSLKRREKELKELNLLLEKSEKNYHDVVQAFSKGLLVFENDILIYSNYFEEIYFNKISVSDYTKGELALNEILIRITGKEYPKDKEINDFSTEVKISNKFGNIRDYEVSLINIYSDRKLLVFYDVTEIIKQREEIAKIEKKIKEENINDEFYSNISHELRTPINVIYSALQLNDIYLKNNQISKINKNNNIIKQNCLRLIRTINNFIDSNKLSEGFLDIDCNIYNIVDIIENVVLSCDYYMNLKETKLTYDPQYEEIYLNCDKNYIERIMLNILSNSLKYGKYDGNIYVTIKVEDDDKIVIEVINDAEAIPEDKRNVIFEKFTKVNTSLNRPSEGSGLGLYLTKGLIELHGGEITISAGVSYGNIFRILLPYDRDLQGRTIYLNNNVEINELQQKIDIEFSDIYF